VAGRRRPAPATAGLLVLAAGGAAYFAGRADDLHQQPLLVVACALAAGLAPARGKGAPRRFGAVVALVRAGGSGHLASALLLPPPGACRAPARRAGSAWRRPSAALPALVADVQRRVLR
jgi:hypothetical protein